MIFWSLSVYCIQVRVRLGEKIPNIDKKEYNNYEIDCLDIVVTQHCFLVTSCFDVISST